jgi:DUF1680 family protein
MRLIASVGHYVATRDATGLQVHQYAAALIEAELERGRRVGVRMETDYPWQGLVKLTIEQTDGFPWRLALRLPGWCDRPALAANGQSVDVAASRAGYATIERTWRKGDAVELELPMAARLSEAHPRIDAARGSVAIERGPLVYCLEQADQDPSVNVLDVEIDERASLKAAWRRDLLGGVMVVNAAGYAVDVGPWNNRLYAPLGSREGAPRRPMRLAAVPYHVWANRGPGAMRVWIPRRGA